MHIGFFRFLGIEKKEPFVRGRKGGQFWRTNYTNLALFCGKLTAQFIIEVQDGSTVVGGEQAQVRPFNLRRLWVEYCFSCITSRRPFSLAPLLVAGREWVFFEGILFRPPTVFCLFEATYTSAREIFPGRRYILLLRRCTNSSSFTTFVPTVQKIILQCIKHPSLLEPYQYCERRTRG